MKTGPAPASPRPHRPRLTPRLAIALVVKILLLTLLWHAFIKPNKVKVDIDAMGSRIAASAPSGSQAHISTTSGDNK